MIQAESTIEIAKPAGQVFAFVDDFAKAPSWMESCVELTQVAAGPRSVGTRLHYVHSQGGRRGEMEGLITAYDRPRLLGMGFGDPKFEVSVELQFIRGGSGTTVRHSITITPKTFFGRLMSPLIRVGNRKQVAANLARLKETVEKMAGIPSGYDAWLCPFCNVPAEQPTTARVLCDSRTCGCGAIALAAPACDLDEIIDDAVGIFGVGIREDTRGYDALILENVRMAGVDIRHGKTVAVGGSDPAKSRPYTSLWFRRSPSR